MSGGERQRFTAFIMAAALSYQLGIAEQGFTTYGTVMMDEAFVLASEEFAGAGIKALHEFGFQLLLAAPENVIDLSRHLGSVTEILRDKRTNRSGVLTAPVIGAPGAARRMAFRSQPRGHRAPLAPTPAHLCRGFSGGRSLTYVGFSGGRSLTEVSERPPADRLLSLDPPQELGGPGL